MCNGILSLWARHVLLCFTPNYVPDAPLSAGIPDSQLDSQVAALQEAGIPLRKLLLPPALVAHVGGDMMARVGELVEVDDFRLDWPTPFARFDEE